MSIYDRDTELVIRCENNYESVRKDYCIEKYLRVFSLYRNYKDFTVIYNKAEIYIL